MVAPPVDLEALVASGERRLHRRRMAITAAGAAVVAVLAVGGALSRNAHHPQTTGPIDLPHLPRPTEDQVPTSVTRQVVYAGGSTTRPSTTGIARSGSAPVTCIST